MTTSEAIDVFKEYLTTGLVPRPMELIEASKIAIKVLTQQLEEMDKQYHWKPSEEQIYSLGTVVKGYNECTVGSVGYHLKEMYEQLKKLM